MTLDADTPVAGFYRFKMRRGGHPVGVRIWYGPPHDPDTGEEMDRSWRWQAQVNGFPVDMQRVWPWCGTDPVDESEYHRLSALAAWGSQHAPGGPQANPHKRIDLLQAPLPF